MSWIKHSERKPAIDQKVVYFFELVGVHRGKYFGDNTYGGKNGILWNDVTHWLPDEGQGLPDKP